MPFVDLEPTKISGPDRITFSQRKDGQHGVTLAFSALVAKRNKLVKNMKAKVMVDLDAEPRVLRVITGEGPFTFAEKKGGAFTLNLPRLNPGLPILTDKAATEYDENDVAGSFDIDLPKAWQRATPSSGYVENKPEPKIPSVSAYKNGGVKGRM